MKEIKAFKDALNSASNDAAHYMTAQLRSEAKASGWPSDVTTSMRIKHTNGSFDVQIPEKYHSRVFDLEYGTPDRQPTAAIRRFANRTDESEHFLLGRMSRTIGDL